MNTEATTTTDTRTKRDRVAGAQTSLDRAHAELATQKGKQMRLLADIVEQNQRVEACAEAIGKAESEMEAALAYVDPPAPEPVRLRDDEFLVALEARLDGLDGDGIRAVLTAEDQKRLASIAKWHEGHGYGLRARNLLSRSMEPAQAQSAVAATALS